MRQRAPPGAKVPPKTISEHWKAASTDLRSAFEAKATADKERYARDRAIYLKTGSVPPMEPVDAPEAEIPDQVADGTPDAAVAPAPEATPAPEETPAPEATPDEATPEEAMPQASVAPETAAAAVPEQAPVPMEVTELPSEPTAEDECDSDDDNLAVPMNMPSIP